jgi:hypothetical protein
MLTMLHSACIFAVALNLLPAWQNVAKTEPRQSTFKAGVCEREGAKLAGGKPVRSTATRAPKQIRYVRPNWPEVPPKTIGRGPWLGEILIDTAGDVTHVWPTREDTFMPPEFNRAIVDSIRQWEFEPLVIQGKAVPVCMAVTVFINWQ